MKNLIRIGIATLVVFCWIIGTSYAAINPDNIMGMWLFNEGSGGTWHFIAGRADTDTGKVSLWVDGKMEAELDFDTESGYGNSEGVFHIGRHFDRYTAGIIDDIALFNVALDEDDMQSIMDDGLMTLTAVEAAGKLTTTWASVKQRIAR